MPPSLKGFDRSDHKWVATYLLGSGEVLYNALDSDWRNDAKLISDAGVNVTELCPADLTLRPDARTVEKKLKDPAPAEDQR